MDLPEYDPYDHYWKKLDGTLFSSRMRREVPGDDSVYHAWITAGHIPTPYPKDTDGNESIDELDLVLAPYGIRASAETPEDRRKAAEKIANTLLSPVVFKACAETVALPDADLVVLAAAGYYDDWAAGKNYAASKRLMHQENLYEVKQAVTSQAHQPPGSDGMLAIYRPVDGATGTIDDPKRLMPGMDALAGIFYRYNGSLWRCLRDLIPTFAGRLPGDPGMDTFWELVEVV